MKPKKDDPIPEGTCTAPNCKCDRFKPFAKSPMYCSEKDCGHSVEWHHLNAKDVLL